MTDATAGGELHIDPQIPKENKKIKIKINGATTIIPKDHGSILNLPCAVKILGTQITGDTVDLTPPTSGSERTTKGQRDNYYLGDDFNEDDFVKVKFTWNDDDSVNGFFRGMTIKNTDVVIKNVGFNLKRTKAHSSEDELSFLVLCPESGTIKFSGCLFKNSYIVTIGGNNPNIYFTDDATMSATSGTYKRSYI